MYTSARCSSLETAGCFTFNFSARSRWVSSRARRNSCNGISACNSLFISSIRMRRADREILGQLAKRIASTHSSKPLLSKLLQMLVVEFICNRHVLLVKPVAAGLVAADEQNGSSPGIEGIEDPQGSAAALPIFSKLLVPLTFRG